VHFLSVCLSLCSELFSLSEKLSWIFYLSLLYVNFSPFPVILSFSPSVQNYFPCRGIFSDILLFPFLSQLFPLSKHSFFFLPLFRIFSFHGNGLGYFSLLSEHSFFSPVQYYVSFQRNGLAYLPFSFLQYLKIFPFSTFFLFLPLFKIIVPFRENG
jgi:hypothetical protein